MSALRNFYRATNPQRVLDKIRECRTFLAQIAEHERSGDRDKFLNSLSSFLAAFRTIASRLYGVVEKQLGRADMKALEARLNSHPRVGFLIDRAILEAHGDGAVIWRRFTVSVSDDIQTKWPSRWSSRFGNRDRWPSRFASRFHSTVRIHSIVGADWQFAGHSSNLLELCRNGLDDIESFGKQNISVGP